MSTPQPYRYEQVEVVRVIDGDTVVLKLTKDFTLEADFGFYIRDKMVLQKQTQMSFRLMGINAPEVVGVNKAAGLSAKAFLEQLLKDSVALRAETFKPDKYGRWLVRLYVRPAIPGTPLEFCVNDEMIAKGHAVAYMVDE